tara:strand:- start:347 stop:1015 length:669 start_codon:yes stop_codon:yes gene_type:complete
LNSSYSIIIPIFNEERYIPELLNNLKKYSEEGHEVLIINDGSNDNSKSLLSNCNFIKLINLENNAGKGTALIEGLKASINNEIIIFDGDLELNPSEIKKLMILDKSRNINSVFANRFSKYQSFSLLDLGNRFITFLFNFLNSSNIKDVLCCAKAFFKSDIQINALKSKKFDIDVEITSHLLNQNLLGKNIDLNYKRRTISQGKKLRIKDGLTIMLKIFQLKV